MPTYLKALIVILVLASIVFAFTKGPACAAVTTKSDFERRRNLWLGITLAAFLAGNFWIFIVVETVLLLLVVPREKNKLAMFFILLFAVPAIQASISGFGIVQQLFTIHHLRLLALTILLPAYLTLRRQPDTKPFGKLLPDKLLLGFMLLQFVLTLTVNSFTNTLRIGIFYAFIDDFLPYYVASRSLKNREQFRDAVMAFVIATMIMSMIGAFEFTNRWLLYSSLEQALGINWEYGGYLHRGDAGLRAQASTGQPIPLGFVMAVAIGLYLFLQKSVKSRSIWMLGMAVLAVGLISALSRGPWMGAAVIILCFLLTSRHAFKHLMQFSLVCAISIPALLLSPYSDKVIDLMPFVGTVDDVNVSYRMRLLEVGLQVILYNPFFGAYSYFMAGADSLVQGNGTIDLVNTYLAVTLQRGLVGLSLFVGFFVAVLVGIFRRMRILLVDDEELHLLGRALLATLIGILFIIATTSSITVIPVVYWAVAGLGVAYANLLLPETRAPKTRGNPESEPPPKKRPLAEQDAGREIPTSPYGRRHR